MRDSKAVGVLAGLAIFGASASLYLSTHGGLPPRLNPRPHEAVGWAMAQQALSLLKAGGQVLVITRDTTAFANPATDLQLASFKKALAKAHATVGPIKALQVDPLRPVEVPAGDFFELIRKTPSESVIVSFMGPPLLSSAQRERLGEIKPAIVAFCAGSLPEVIDLRKLFEQKFLHAAVVSRRNPGPISSASSLQGWFDQSFLTITPANLAALPVPSGASPN